MLVLRNCLKKKKKKENTDFLFSVTDFFGQKRKIGKEINTRLVLHRVSLVFNAGLALK